MHEDKRDNNNKQLKHKTEQDTSDKPYYCKSVPNETFEVN